MKEMIYYPNFLKKVEVLHSGEYKGRKFAITSIGIHPCAYVQIFCGTKNYYDKRFEPIDVHCGFTFAGHAHWDDTDKAHYIGWDYGHCCDFAGYFENKIFSTDMRKWTTEEIFEEVKGVIEQLNTLAERGVKC
jgi:hypothetical protein